MDIALDTSGDMALPPRLVTGADAVRQSLQIRLRFFAGEWFLDTGAGIPYFSRILSKQPKGLRPVDAIFKDAILKTPGVSALLEWSSTLDSARRYTVKFKVSTIFGPLGMTWQA